MHDTINFLLSNNGLAFAVALIIFVITLILVVKRLIGFVITLILLVFAIVSGFFVANQDLLRNFLKSYSSNSTPAEQLKREEIKGQLYKSYEELKNDLIKQKDDLEKIIRKTDDTEKSTEPVKPDSTPTHTDTSTTKE